MTTSTNNHRPATFVAAAVTGLVGALLASAPHSAQAIPERDHPRAVVGRTTGHYVERACFIKPLSWNESVDGRLPRCHTYVP